MTDIEIAQKAKKEHIADIAKKVNIPDEYVEHGNVDILRKEVGIDEETIFNRIYNNI